LGLTFFGLTPDTVPQSRSAIFTQIHEIVFHGKGGYDWETIYNMPIWLRRFTFNKINEFYKEENNQIEKTQNGGKSKNLIDPSGKVNTPDFAKTQPPNSAPARYK
tara:strand:- start:2337 stop:2651 length:315 start_codon:yes stop_codon:yes gene_type:complete